MKEAVLESTIDCSEHGWVVYPEICLKRGRNSINNKRAQLKA
jgi:hypothetical protein